MNRVFYTVLLAMLGLTVSGCIETQMLVSVNSDGSGTIEERMLMNKMVIGMLEGMGDAFKVEGEEEDSDEPVEQAEPFSMFSEDDVAERAEKMGAGVKLVSYEEVESATGTGYSARFTFDDINAINMDQNPGSALPDMPGEEQSAEEKEERIHFQFTPGSPARLVIKPFIEEEEIEEEITEDMPEDEQSDEPGESDMEFEQMKELFRGMRMTLAIKVNGNIEETNAQFVDGSTITLIDFNFDQMLDNPEALKVLEKSEEMSPAAAQEVLKGIEGIKFDIDDEIVVTFD